MKENSLHKNKEIIYADPEKGIRFSVEDFGKEKWERTVAVYRETISALADVFAEGKYEITGTDFVRDVESQEIKALIIGINLFEKTLKDFRDFLQKHDGFIHQDFRKGLEVYIGSRGEEGGIHIGGKEIELVAPDILAHLKSDRNVGYGVKPEVQEKLQKLHEEFKKLMEQKIQKEL